MLVAAPNASRVENENEIGEITKVNAQKSK